MEFEVIINTSNETDQILLKSLANWLDNETIEGLNISYSKSKVDADDAGIGIIEALLIIIAEKSIEKILDSTYSWLKSKHKSSNKGTQEVKIYIKRKDGKKYKVTPEKDLDDEEVKNIKNFIENI